MKSRGLTMDHNRLAERDMTGARKKKKPKVLTGLAAKQAIMRAICRAIERDK
jgi:hypothetical protein